MNNIHKNIVTVSGVIQSKLKFVNEIMGERFYTTILQITRSSNISDYVPLTLSDRIVNTAKDYIGRYAEIQGEIRSYDKPHGSGYKLILSVFADSILFYDECPQVDKNSVEICGCICKLPTYRITPNGREITDVLLAVNRRYNKSDYIPCICWGKGARYAKKLEVGECVTVNGRFQSRNYEKNIDGNIVVNRALEVSVKTIE